MKLLYRKAEMAFTFVPRDARAKRSITKLFWYAVRIVTPAPTSPIYLRPFTKMQSMALVFCCTVLGAAAQMLMKIGTAHLAHPGLAGYLTDVPLLAGYCLYGVNTVLLVFALRDGELSILYPIIALTYVWVTILSVLFFHESLNVFKVAGIAVVVAGVAVMGKSAKA
jgi:multidrug transporter EmrE-like cation transporter